MCVVYYRCFISSVGWRSGVSVTCLSQSLPIPHPLIYLHISWLPTIERISFRHSLKWVTTCVKDIYITECHPNTTDTARQILKCVPTVGRSVWLQPMPAEGAARHLIACAACCHLLLDKLCCLAMDLLSGRTQSNVWTIKFKVVLRCMNFEKHELFTYFENIRLTDSNMYIAIY